TPFSRHESQRAHLSDPGSTPADSGSLPADVRPDHSQNRRHDKANRRSREEHLRADDSKPDRANSAMSDLPLFFSFLVITAYFFSALLIIPNRANFSTLRYLNHSCSLKMCL
ncbi:hypothetical protein PENTCL1PPCAC_23458, partial [Pristionchus entomophagus]